MSSLSTAEQLYFEEILDMSGGYVLHFTNETFGDFFRNYGIDIHGSRRYLINGTSKAKKMRAFWKQDSDELVGRVLNELLDIYEANCELAGRVSDMHVLQKCRITIDRLIGITNTSSPTSDKEFISKNIKLPELRKLPVPPAAAEVIEARLQEAELALEAGAHLSVIFLCGVSWKEYYSVRL